MAEWLKAHALESVFTRKGIYFDVAKLWGVFFEEIHIPGKPGGQYHFYPWWRRPGKIRPDYGEVIMPKTKWRKEVVIYPIMANEIQLDSRRWN